MNKNKSSRWLNTIGLILCLVLLPVLVVNVTMIAQSFLQPDKVPGFLGYKPFIVLSGSMQPLILEGDLIITREEDVHSLKVDDVIAYRFGENAVVTHRILAVEEFKGQPLFTTKGDFNNVEDKDKVVASRVEGKYILRVPGLGRFAMFLQTPLGLLLVVGAPILLYIILDTLLRRKDKHSAQQEADALKDELAALKAQLKQTDTPPNPGTEEKQPR